ncbi:hypothetical protein [Paraburkholderia sp. BL25I1N1]|uniref:hypothetical protein n=1 Tax=Paraburkholderia sp. BL25I1N1 TaxID=1938804 RepID=UPI0015E5B428|nr:hypothetical protein [Paraburkholderia sp. BL25I1N1]
MEIRNGTHRGGSVTTKHMTSSDSGYLVESVVMVSLVCRAIVERCSYRKKYKSVVSDHAANPPTGIRSDGNRQHE